MIRLLKELYFAMFTFGFRCRAPQKLGGGWGPEVDGIKGAAVPGFTMYVIYSNVLSWFEISVGRIFYIDSSRWIENTVGMAFFFANYYFLVIRGHGIKFEREFTHLKKLRKVLLLVGCALILLATVVFATYTHNPYLHFLNSIRQP